MKSIIIILFGIAIYHDIVTVQTACGYATAIIGFGFYNYAKIKAKEEDGRCSPQIAAEGGRRRVLCRAKKHRYLRVRVGVVYTTTAT